MVTSDATTRFSHRVQDYVKYRPSYPKQLLDFMCDELGLGEKSTVADVGSGTGIFTRLLLERGATVYAVEPNADMRSAAENALASFTKFKSLGRPAEQTDLPDASVDLVTAATAFHWFNPVLVKTEWKRILRPNGIALIVWNVRRESSPFLADYENLLRRFAPGYGEAKHRNTEDNSGLATFFTPNKPRTISFPNEQIFDFDGLTGRLLSSSYSPLEGHPNHLPMLQELRNIFDKHQVGGKVRYDYDSKAYFGTF